MESPVEPEEAKRPTAPVREPVVPTEPAHGSLGRNPRAWFVAVFALAGLLHVIGAGLSTRVYAIPATAEFGLFQTLPPFYWLGLGLLAVSVLLALRERSDLLVVGTGCLLLAVLAGTPNLFEPNPTNWDSYFHLNEAQMILLTGHLPAVNVGQYSANWPGIFLVIAMLNLTGGLSPLGFLAVFPFLAGALTFAALFVFLREVFSHEIAGPGALLSSLFAVWAQYHLSPQALGFVMALLLLAIVWRADFRWRAASGLLFVGLVVSHPTSTLLLLAILAFMSLLSPFMRRSLPRPELRSIRWLTVAFAGIWFAWLYFHATASYQVAQTAILSRLVGLVSLPEQTVNLATARTAENLFPLASTLRFAAVGVYGIVGILSLAVLARRPEHRRLVWFLGSAFLAIGAFAGVDIVALGGQFYDRPFLFFAVLAPALCVTGLRNVRMPGSLRRVAVVVLVAAAVATASTAYYLESFYEVPDRSVAFSNFLERVSPTSVVLGGMYPLPVWLDPATRHGFAHVEYYQIYPASLGAVANAAPTYAAFDPVSQLWYRQWIGIGVYQTYEGQVSNYSRIYDNGQAALYFVGG